MHDLFRDLGHGIFGVYATFLSLRLSADVKTSV